MCKDCGCGLPGDNPAGVKSFPAGHEHPHEHPHGHEHAHHNDHQHNPGELHDHDHPHDREHGHDHDHAHGHGHPHTHTHSHVHRHGDLVHEHPHPHEHAHTHEHEGEGRRSVEVHRAILEKNDRLAERNRGFFRARGVLVLNVLSSPGSGKTTFLRETLRTLRLLKAGVIVGDLATDNDAQRLRESGAPVVQITTGTVCHLDAEMVTRAVKQMDLQGLGLLVIENVGNLVCPASYDLGEDLRVVLLSVTEGEDKPLKYPPMFQMADVVIVSKSDLAEAAGFNRQLLLANLSKVAPRARVFELSAKTGAGMDAWREFLLEKQKEHTARDPLAL